VFEYSEILLCVNNHIHIERKGPENLSQTVNQYLYITHRAFFIPPAFVISSLRASMAALIRDTSLPPTYYDAFISQLSTILTQGFLPYLAWSTYAFAIAASCSLLYFFPDAYLSLSSFHSYNFIWAVALRSLFISDSFCNFS
jgi:hypothetical protein